VYRALKTVEERRDCFERYCRDKQQQDREKRMSKKEQDEHKLRVLFKKHNVLPSTRFRTAQRLFADEPDWNQCPANHRRTVFFQYVDNLKNAQKNAEREVRKANLSKLKQLFTFLEIDHTISWKDAQQKWQAHEMFRSDENLSKMDPMDILIAFEDWVMTLDSKFRQSRSARLRTVLRRDRQIRDSYKDLLREHSKDGKITRIKWKDFYPLVKNDKRYRDMIETVGSSPLDLFWDWQMKLDDDYRSDRHEISDFVKVNV
jgi:pre-mRNA-processing factor 40